MKTSGETINRSDIYLKLKNFKVFKNKIKK